MYWIQCFWKLDINWVVNNWLFLLKSFLISSVLCLNFYWVCGQSFISINRLHRFTLYPTKTERKENLIKTKSQHLAFESLSPNSIITQRARHSSLGLVLGRHNLVSTTTNSCSWLIKMLLQQARVHRFQHIHHRLIWF